MSDIEVLAQESDERRRQKLVNVFDIKGMVAHDDTAQAFVHELQTCLDAVPEQFRDQVRLELSTDWETGYLDQACAYYYRAETDDEQAARIRRLADNRRRVAENRRQADLTEFLRLKAIFEPAVVDTVAQL